MLNPPRCGHSPAESALEGATEAVQAAANSLIKTEREDEDPRRLPPLRDEAGTGTVLPTIHLRVSVAAARSLVFSLPSAGLSEILRNPVNEIVHSPHGLPGLGPLLMAGNASFSENRSQTAIEVIEATVKPSATTIGIAGSHFSSN